MAQIWTCNEVSEELELQAGAGLNSQPCTLLDIQEIARLRQAQWNNPAAGDMDAFVSSAGFPLVLEGRMLGVAAVFGHAPFFDPARQTFTSLALQLAEFIRRKRAEQELITAKIAAEAANQAKIEFLSNISHELRTPMNSILGLTDVVLHSNLTSSQRDLLDTVKLSSMNLLGMIKDLLDFSQIDAGKLVLSGTAICVRDLLSATLGPLQEIANQKALQLSWEVDAAVPVDVAGDAGRLEQILVNLVGNAIKFTACGQVKLRLRCTLQTADATELEFTVSDTGVGIPADKQQLIFQAFTQADGSLTRQFGGTGLGLTIAAKLVEMMHGRLWFESEVGRGSTFYFTARLGTV